MLARLIHSSFTPPTPGRQLQTTAKNYVPGVYDLNVYQAGAQTEALQVVLGDSEQVVVVRPIPVPVQIGAVVTALEASFGAVVKK